MFGALTAPRPATLGHLQALLGVQSARNSSSRTYNLDCMFCYDTGMLKSSLPTVPRKRTQRERSTATQDKLLNATITCIVELGYAGTSTTLVCQRAGVSRGAQVHHFPTKAALVAAAIERLFARMHDEFRSRLAASPSSDPSGSLPDPDRAFAELWALYQGPTLCAWMELLIAARTDTVLHEQLRDVDQRFFADAKQTCRRLFGLETAQDDALVAGLARLILSVFDGLALNHLLGHPERDYEVSLSLFKEMVRVQQDRRRNV